MEDLENKTIEEINKILEEKGYSQDCVYPKSEVDNHFTSICQFLDGLSQFDSNVYTSTYFRKDSFGKYIGFDTENEAKEYALNIAKGLI